MSEYADTGRDVTSERKEQPGPDSGPVLSDLARPRIRSRSALLVAFAVGIALFVLVASAFSVAAESRVVATKSNQLHGFDDVLRLTVASRSDLGAALQFSLLDEQQGTDSFELIDQTLRNARESLDRLGTAVDGLPDDDASAQINEFAASSGEAVRLLETGDPDDLMSARERVVGDVDRQYEVLIEDLLAGRAALVQDLTEADENLGRLGTLATFIIAFFVPTVAMFVYRQITRRQRETIELARLLSEARAGVDWRSDLIHSAASMADAEADALPASSMTASLRSRLRDLDFLVGATAIGHGYVFEALTISEIREHVQKQWPGLVSIAGDGSDVMWGDRDAVLLLCNDIVRNAQRRGAERVLISGGRDSDGVWLSITDNGQRVDPAAVQAILQSPSLIDATDEHLSTRLDSDSSLMLIFGRLIAPALGGSFWSDTVGSNTRCTLRLPAARVRKSAGAKLTTAR